MSYTDSLQIRYYQGVNVGNATGNIIDLDSGLASGTRCPSGATIVTFGVLVNGPTTVTTPIIFGVSVGKAIFDVNGTLVGTLTIPTRTLVAGERFESGQFGARASRVLPGGKVIVSVQQTGAPAAGNLECYVILRLEGYSAGLKVGGTGQTNNDSPLTVLFS